MRSSELTELFLAGSSERHPRTTIGQWIVYVLAIIGGMTIFLGILPRTTFQLDFAGDAEMVHSSWWGLWSERYPVRLQNIEDWRTGISYRRPRDWDEYEWFMKGMSGEWYPIGFSEPSDDQY